MLYIFIHIHIHTKAIYMPCHRSSHASKVLFTLNLISNLKHLDNKDNHSSITHDHLQKKTQHCFDIVYILVSEGNLLAVSSVCFQL